MPLGANKAAIMGVAGVSTGDVVLLRTITISDDAIAEFTSNLTSTYGEYIFKWYNIHQSSTSDTQLQFGMSDDAGSNYDLSHTTTFWNAYQEESAGAEEFGYSASYDTHNGAVTTLVPSVGNGADNSTTGELHLFNPASTTYITHFHSRGQTLGGTSSRDAFAAGYANATAAVTGVKFLMASGDIASGTIKMWGVK